MLYSAYFDHQSGLAREIRREPNRQCWRMGPGDPAESKLLEPNQSAELLERLAQNELLLQFL